ncbi:MAG: SpoIID/LytB domain-containing protein [Acidobacteria bacterium]|nr:SpoIID/LytB domain-containing protein [Acidobacteriota bacterium]
MAESFSKSRETTTARRLDAVRRAWSSALLSGLRGVRTRHASHRMAHACVCVAMLCVWSLPHGDRTTLRRAPVINATSEDEIDAALQRAAASALGGREGTIMLMDARTGRLRAVANSRVAFEEATAPGSTIKAFTMLAALRSGVLNEETRVQCREHYERGDLKMTCSHTRFKPAFDPAQALAYSCNYFFAKVGERLDGETFDETLASFGFGARTGGDEGEAAGELPRGRWQVRHALGESRQLSVTPAQLITAYAALVNGGQLFIPRRAPAEGFVPRVRAQLDIAPAHRTLVLEGMRGAVTYGTAMHAGLDSPARYIFGKTGTSTPGDDFHSQGWFVGFAAEKNPGDDAPPPAEAVKLAVLVHLKHAHGSECAEISQPLFDEYERLQTQRVAEQAAAFDGEREHDDGRASVDDEHAEEMQVSPVEASSGGEIRVRLSREERTIRLSLDDYVFGVLAAEGSVEEELEALKAQAVISRTYALKNLRRHAREGYDMCTSTHCQRFMLVRDESVRPGFYDLLRRAVAETRGEVLRDAQGRVAEGYFSASCGGATADISTLWGVGSAPPQLRGVRDDFCAGDRYRSWTDVIPAAQLLKALRSDPRSDVGAHLDAVRVVRRDRTGRAEIVALDGERRRTLGGWDFKIIVGRTLGWSVLKSSRFEVSRAGANFVFHGSGFGHGLGLCQSGAHVMAQRGASYRQILSQYLPGTILGGA